MFNIKNALHVFGVRVILSLTSQSEWRSKFWVWGEETGVKET